MRTTLKLLAAAPLLACAPFAACGDDDSDLQIDATITEALDDLSSDIEDQLAGVDIEELSDDARLAVDEQCSQLTEEAANSDLSSELTDICGDIRQALTEGSQDALDAARDRLEEALD
jgi:hypothetical protein